MTPRYTTDIDRPSPLQVTHGQEIAMLLENNRQVRVIRRLGTVIVLLSIALAYCLQWAEMHGL